jgi:hypothetical protein
MRRNLSSGGLGCPADRDDIKFLVTPWRFPSGSLRLPIPREDDRPGQEGRDRHEEALRGCGHCCDLFALLVTPAMAKGGRGGGNPTTTSNAPKLAVKDTDVHYSETVTITAEYGIPGSVRYSIGLGISAGSIRRSVLHVRAIHSRPEPLSRAFTLGHSSVATNDGFVDGTAAAYAAVSISSTTPGRTNPRARLRPHTHHVRRGGLGSQIAKQKGPGPAGPLLPWSVWTTGRG